RIVTVYTDNSPPRLENIKANPNVQLINNRVNITCEVFDILGVANVTLHIFYPYGENINVTMLRYNDTSYYYNQTYAIAGNYDYFITAEDFLGNENTSSTYSFRVNIPPVANFTFEPSNPTTADTIYFNSTSTDSDGYIVNWIWDMGDGTILYGEKVTYSYADDGTYLVTLTVTDDDGATDSITKQIVVLPVPPTTSCSVYGDEGEHGWYLSEVTIVLNASDDRGVKATYYKVDGGAWHLYENPFTISSSGVHTISFYSIDVTDCAEAVKTKTVKIDKTVPWTEIIVRGNEINGWYSGNVIIGFVGHDTFSGVDKIMYRLDNETWREYGTAMEILQEGEHVLEYYAIDRAGNSEEIKTFEFRIDRMPPNINLLYPSGEEILNGTIDIRWEAIDESKISIDLYYSNDGGETWHLIAANEENDGVYEWDTTGVEDGMNYKIKVVTRDIVGHTGADSTGKFTIYNNFLTASIDKPRDGYLYINDREIIPLPGKITVIIGKISIVASIQCGLLDRVEFYIDNELKETKYQPPYEWEWNEFAMGYHQIKIVAYDLIGNRVEDEKSVLAIIF
ncbi:MAG: PKD domain-containing protein, partial [Thermoplasmata archaeon]|nr:PKD domain-containing protein [Thermoplasmata archaeon]